jgi:hypothetical protein
MNVEIISLIYKSTKYLNLIVKELNEDYCKVEGYDIGIRVVANDATEKVLAALQPAGVPYSIYNDPKPNDYYLNRVYRCWNYAGKTSNYDNICFVNSDMIFSNGWLSNLLKHHNNKNIPCSRLVESGKMLSGRNAIGNKNFGRTPEEIDFDSWYLFANEIKKSELHIGGLYMPCLFSKQRFIESGMYPEGNIYQDGRAGSMHGNVILSGDDYYFRLLSKRFGMSHVTVFDSLVYHIQEGEMDE